MNVDYPPLPDEPIGSEFHPEFREIPWHAGMGKPGHTCNYCANKKLQMSRIYKPSGYMPRNPAEARRRQAELRFARASSMRALTFPSSMSVGGRAPMGGIIRYEQTHSGGEIKSLDTVAPTANATATAPWNFNATATIAILNPVTIGSSMWNRVGRKISLKSIHIQGWFLPAGNNMISNNQFARMIILYDKQPNGALPAISDVLQDQTNGASDAHQTTPYSGINLNNRERFEIIMDKRFVLPGGNTTVPTQGIDSSTADLMHIEAYAKLKNRETHFKADSSPGVIGDIATGSLVMITYGDKTAGNEPWSADLNVRLRYSDL